MAMACTLSKLNSETVYYTAFTQFEPCCFQCYGLLPPRCLALSLYPGPFYLSVQRVAMWARSFRTVAGPKGCCRSGPPSFWLFRHLSRLSHTPLCLPLLLILTLPPFSCYLTLFRTSVRSGVVVDLYLAFPERMLCERGNNSALSPLTTPQPD